jgi:pilus assembly protein CpaF
VSEPAGAPFVAEDRFGGWTPDDPAAVPVLRPAAGAASDEAVARRRPPGRRAAVDRRWEDVIAQIRHDVIDAVDARRTQGLPVTAEHRDSLAEEEVAAWLRREAEACIRDGVPPPPPAVADWVRAEVRAAVSALGPIVKFLNAARWSDVEINGMQNVVCTERGTGLRHEFTSPFTTDAAAFEWAAQHAAEAGRRFDESTPSVRFRLAKGMRVHAIGRVTSRTHIDIRLFVPGLEDLQGLTAAGMFGPDIALLLQATAAVRDPIGIIFPAAPATGRRHSCAPG